MNFQAGYDFLIMTREMSKNPVHAGYAHRINIMSLTRNPKFYCAIRAS